MKDESLYQKLKLAKKEERIASSKVFKTTAAMEKEIAAATKAIQEKYDAILRPLVKDASDKGSLVWEIGGQYRDYGSFRRFDIVNIFATFLSFIEGESYIPYASSEVSQNSIIVKEEVIKQYERLNYDLLDYLYENGDLIMLDDEYSNIVNLYNNIGDPNFKFGRFNYLREFVNRLMQYRINNDKKDMTEEEFILFMSHFVATHPDLAQKNKEKREQMLMEQGEKTTTIAGVKKLNLSSN